MQRIYLDNAATTNIDPKVIEAMSKSHEFFGNPSSLHSFGQGARKLVDQSRDTVAEFLNCKPTEIIFTSGGSESDNLAIKGVIDAFYSSREKGERRKENNETTNSPLQTPHVVTSAIEHHAVLHTIEDLEKEGKIEATYVRPNKFGVIQTEDIKSAIKDNTVLVSVMYVNNEVGTVQPIREIGQMIERYNSRQSAVGSRQISANRKPQTANRIYFHTDAVQAAEFFDMDTKYLHVDLLTLTAHKFHGPKGIGVFFVKKGTPINPEIVGGDQEFRFRAGTENTASIVGLAAAIEEITKSKDSHSESEFSGEESSPDTLGHIDPSASPQDDKKDAQDDNNIKIKHLRDKLEDSILKNIPETYLNGDRDKRSPAILNISFKNAEGEAIILNLDFLGIAVSSGSACTARSLDPSHVLMAMNLPRELSHGAIRFSLSRETTEDEIDKVIEVLPGIIKKLREMSPFK
jgi:cysteine desulfurase